MMFSFAMSGFPEWIVFGRDFFWLEIPNPSHAMRGEGIPKIAVVLRS